jgi:hypothetical protein
MSEDGTTTGGKPERRRNPEAELLAGSGFEHLPETFAMQMEDRSVVQERDACYYIRSDCALGVGRELTLWEEGSIIVTDAVPNMHMEPLNRAAAVQFVKWQQRLPANRAPIDIGDMAEAAQMLGSDPEILKLNRVQWQDAVVKLATELKLRREGREARDLPPIGHNFVRGPRSAAPPILNAKVADMSQRLPGETRFAAAIPAHAPGPTVRRAAPQPMNMPGGR